MSDLNTKIVASKKRRSPQPRHRIDLPNGEFLQPRRDFAAEIGVVDKTCARMNLPTTYVGNVAYVAHNASLNILAERVQRRNQPPERRRLHRAR